jgi:hypothetical protein
MGSLIIVFFQIHHIHHTLASSPEHQVVAWIYLETRFHAHSTISWIRSHEFLPCGGEVPAISWSDMKPLAMYRHHLAA